MLLITGYSGAAAGWDPQFLAALGRSFEVICPDNRGMGDSQLGELREPLTIESMATDLEALLDAREIERLPVAGWSMGGFIAQALAIQAPARVEALILLATNPGGDAAAPGDPAAFKRLIDHSGTPHEQATRLIDLLFPANVAPEMNQRIGDVVTADRAALSPATLAAQRAAIGTWSVRGLARPDASSPPVLAVCGSEDAVIRPENTDRLAARWPNCRAECFQGDGHALQAQKPERLAALITSFLGE